MREWWLLDWEWEWFTLGWVRDREVREWWVFMVDNVAIDKDQLKGCWRQWCCVCQLCVGQPTCEPNKELRDEWMNQVSRDECMQLLLLTRVVIHHDVRSCVPTSINEWHWCRHVQLCFAAAPRRDVNWWVNNICSHANQVEHVVLLEKAWVQRTHVPHSFSCGTQLSNVLHSHYLWFALVLFVRLLGEIDQHLFMCHARKSAHKNEASKIVHSWRFLRFPEHSSGCLSNALGAAQCLALLLLCQTTSRVLWCM